MTFYTYNTAQKLSFLLRIYSVNVTKSAVSFTEETLNEKLDFLCSANYFRILLDFFGAKCRDIISWNRDSGVFLEKGAPNLKTQRENFF